jgi:FdhD protein
MKNVGSIPIRTAAVLDKYGQPCTVLVVDEMPITIFLDNQKIVTLMTLGNQNFIQTLSKIKSIHISPEKKTVEIYTVDNLDTKKTAFGTVQSGCGQGLSININLLQNVPPLQTTIKQSLIYTLLDTLAQHNQIHRQAGGVHTCALCQIHDIIGFVEDVGRHNAIDTIAGLMWLNDWNGENKIFYTTGRLTSEMVMKVALMGISVLLSRSGVTYNGIEIAKKVGMTLIAHAKSQHFLVFNGGKNIIFDAN